MSTIEVDGVELFYERRGEGEQIFLTHGAWTDGRTWQGLTSILVDRFEVLVWDRRGHSRSQIGEHPGSVGQDAKDLAALIEANGRGPVHLVGNSAGGNVVLNFAASRSDLVRTVAVHEPGPFALALESDEPEMAELVRHDRQLTDQVLGLIESGQARRAVEYFVDQVAIGPGAWRQFPEQLKTVMEDNAETVADDIRDGWDPHSLDVDALSRTAKPLLISTGLESPRVVRAAAVQLAERLPSARLAEIEGAGHIPHRTHTEAYAGMIVQFIEASREKVS